VWDLVSCYPPKKTSIKPTKRRNIANIWLVPLVTVHGLNPPSYCAMYRKVHDLHPLLKAIPKHHESVAFLKASYLHYAATQRSVPPINPAYLSLTLAEYFPPHKTA
jgi:hypothetical protein